ncbi:MAG: SDR family NAD(P)-dependent oxidoreductase [Nitrospirales bacterium]
MSTQDQHKGLAIITGASRGIGAEYAKQLAIRGYSLILIARDTDKLERVSDEISQTHHVEVSTLCLDLSIVGAAHQMFVAAQNCSKPVDVLINNAGFGMYGEFVNMPLPRIQEMLQLHINSIVESTRLFLPPMIERQTGAIINVASVAGFFPIPYIAEYAATKAFLISFSEAVAEEVRESGITVQACCPGFTNTDFHKTAGHQPRNPLSPQQSDQVVTTSLRALDAQLSHVTIGWQGWLSQFASRMVPRRLLIRMAGNRTKPTA